MPTPELIDSAQKALSAMTRQPRDSEEEYYWRCAVVVVIVQAHDEWLAERIPVMAEAIRLALETGDNVPACLPDLCKYEPCACCEVAAKAAISAALKDSEKGE